MHLTPTLPLSPAALSEAPPRYIQGHVVVSDCKQESSMNSQRLFKNQSHYFVMSMSDCSTLPTWQH